MQATVSGSRKVLLFTLTPNSHRRHRDALAPHVDAPSDPQGGAWGYFGQRVRYLLPGALAPARPERRRPARPHALDNAKMPYFVPAPARLLGRRARLYGEAYDFEGKGVRRGA